MTRYTELSEQELKTLQAELEEEHANICAKGLELNMARGKPGSEQLDLSRPMLETLDAQSDLLASDGTDCRNYGVLTGLPEAKELIAAMVDARPEQVIVCGNASLNVMYDTVARAFTHGLDGGEPWCKQGSIKFLCPAPGYDRHFAICEAFGIEMIPVRMREDGPDVDAVRDHVEHDAQVKGMWCVPQYSNPQGYTYSDETVRALAALKPAAPDFRLMWDNAYCVHHLYGEQQQDHVLNILQECAAAGSPNMAFEFCSTSKITFPGAGVAAFVSSEENVAEAAKHMAAQTIGHDKLNQLRHVRFLKGVRGVAEHMAKHAELLRPRFEAVYEILDADLGPCGIGTWTKPNGGYFISFEGHEGTARRIVELAREAGVVMTGAGATWPYGNDPADSNIRIAPSFPSIEDLKNAARVFTLCARLATVEKLLGNQ